ncbi:hypothetical protein BD410DRAFT_790379 [Rickenella mellea]|uniref:F-box domain-containing protein n=1 Tax=Rickenella mellea TaxID=50990 RepID=A0A4Y7Q2I1_9AGAM|nr:hypothetical protein BD410DRAFT_790379 [Rickenella mellea]
MVDATAQAVTAPNLSDAVGQMSLNHPLHQDSLNLRQPAQSLPFDILSRIFIECNAQNEDGFPKLSTRKAPSVLGHICSHWRDVASATHTLWAELHIFLGYRTTHNYLKAAVAAWENRAGQLPLSFHISATSYPDSPDARTIAVVDAIMPHRERWKHVGGTLPFEQWSAICSAISNGAPLLEHLNISGYFGRGKFIDIQLSTAPMLETLVVNANHRLLRLDSHSQSLRRLSVYGAEQIECLSYLLWSSKLEEFELKCGAHNRHINWDKGIVETTRLVSLKLDARFTPHILDRLRSPLLQILDLDCGHTGTSLESFLIRSKPSLKSLRVNVDIDPGDLFNCLRYAPTLRALRIAYNPELTGLDVERLKLGSNVNENICPALEKMEFDCCIVGDMEYLEEVVLSRWKGPPVVAALPSSTSGTEYALDGSWERSLRHVTLDGCYFEVYTKGLVCYFTDRPKIRKCIKEGLVIFEELPSDSDDSVF